MKKLIIIVTAIVLCLIFTLFACKKQDKQLEELKNYVSFVDQEVYEGANNDFSVKVTFGQKESVFVADGKVGNKENFYKLEVTPLHIDLLNKDYTYTITDIESNVIEGSLAKNTFSSGYEAALTIPEQFKEIVTVCISCENTQYLTDMTNCTKNSITYSDALEKAKNEFDEKLKECYDENGKFTREICVKFINDKDEGNTPYFWYVAFIASQKDYFAVLINPQSGEIATKRE